MIEIIIIFALGAAAGYAFRGLINKEIKKVGDELKALIAEGFKKA